MACYQTFLPGTPVCQTCRISALAYRFPGRTYRGPLMRFWENTVPMPSKAAQREYQRRWKNARRAAFLQGKSCAWCGSTAGLEIDHIDQAAKEDHRIWSWSSERRLRELAKCQVLCRQCHEARTRDQCQHLRKLSEEDIRTIRQLHTAGMSARGLGRIFGVCDSTIRRVLKREAWRHVS